MAIRSLGSGQKAALIVNECQRGLLDPSLALIPGLPEEAARRDMVANIVRLLAHFRARGLPVVFTPFAFRDDMADVIVNSLLIAMSAKTGRMKRGNPEAEPMPGLEPQPGDYEFVRTATLIAFNQPELDATLRRLGVETVVLTGISTNVAIAGNTMAATDCGYHVVIPDDCITGSDEETHRIIVDNQLRLLATITDSAAIIAATS